MKKVIIAIALCLTSALRMQAQESMEFDYLSNLSTSFTTNTITHKASKLFWSLCLAGKQELSNEELGKGYALLATDSNARIAFYKRFNYYLSGNLGYYTDLMELEKAVTLKNDKVAYVPAFDYNDLKQLAATMHAYGQDELLAAGWSAGPEPVAGEVPVTGPGSVAKDSVFTIVDEMPQFPGGGDMAMIHFLQKHMVYPQMERDNDIQGRVILKFRVCDDGYLCTASTVRTVTDNLNTEAIRVLKMMPNWTPGKQSGKNVSVWFHLPIVFKLQ